MINILLVFIACYLLLKAIKDKKACKNTGKTWLLFAITCIAFLIIYALTNPI